MPRLQQRLGDMGPADRAFTRNLQNALEADRRAHPCQHFRHLARPAHPALADARQLGVQFRVRVIYEVTENVHFCARHVGVDFDAGNDLDAGRLPRGQPFGHTGHGVVVGDRNDLEREPRGAADQHGGRQAAVGCSCVRVEIDLVHAPAPALSSASKPASASRRK